MKSNRLVCLALFACAHVVEPHHHVQHSEPHTTNFSEIDAETKAALEEERLVKAASKSVIKKVVATPTIERGPLGI
jgi:hypothetical protein